MKAIPYPASIRLASVPTPLEPLNFSQIPTGSRIYLKRDDLTGTVLSGNKVRKLEFLLAEARRQGCDTVITCGGGQSNHTRATGAAPARPGLKRVLVLRGNSDV